MTEQEKDILAKDLCCRLPYRLKIRLDEDGCQQDFVLGEIGWKYVSEHLDRVKPYLRPMSDMCDREHREYTYAIVPREPTKMEHWIGCFNWLHKNHFDYRGLIGMGLALEAPDGMYSNKPKGYSPEPTPFRDRNGVQIYDGDIFVYLRYEDFKDNIPPADLIENYSKYEDRVCLHPVFWRDGFWCSDVYGDCDNLASYDFNEVVVVSNKGEHPELYNY